MTADQYTDLIEFLSRKFSGVERRLDAHDREFEEVRRHSTALFEQSRRELRLVAEGVDARFEKVDARLDVMDARLDVMDGRLGAVEWRLASLDESVRLTLTDHESRLRALE